MAIEQINSYSLSRSWFDFCFENPELINPTHTAIYFFAIEHCNRLGWKDKFGFPTQMTMDAIGIKKHQTYIKYFNDLIDWGFIKLIERSKNQYSANIISIQCANLKNGKALDKAFINHAAKQIASTGQSKDSIDKQDNQLTINTDADKSATQTLDDRKKDFYNSLKPFVKDYSKKMMREFYDYWTEASPNGKKMRFEKQTVFEIKRRLVTWAKRAGIEPPEPQKPAQERFSEASYNKTLWTTEAWERHYGWRLESEPEFRQYFGYGELQKS